MSRRHRIYAASFALIAVAAFCGELALGPYPIPFPDVLRALGGLGSDSAVVIGLRLPRAVLSVAIGAGLAVSGAAMQAVLRNPLAEPGLTGVSAGSALAAAAVFALFGDGVLSGVPELQPYVLSVAAFTGGAIAAALVLGLAQGRDGTGVSSLLLAGVAVNAVAAAAIGWLSLGIHSQALRNFLLWAYGDLGRADGRETVIAGVLMLIAMIGIVCRAPQLDALLLGEAEAAHLGIAVKQLKLWLLAAVVLTAAAAVAAAGPIGFIGLIAPHIARKLFGVGHRRLLPMAALIGAALLCAADLAARLIEEPAEVPVGLLTALIGGPFFLSLLAVQRRGRHSA